MTERQTLFQSLRRRRIEQRIKRNRRRSGWVIGCASGKHADTGRCCCTERDAMNIALRCHA